MKTLEKGEERRRSRAVEGREERSRGEVNVGRTRKYMGLGCAIEKKLTPQRGVIWGGKTKT